MQSILLSFFVYFLVSSSFLSSSYAEDYVYAQSEVVIDVGIQKKKKPTKIYCDSNLDEDLKIYALLDDAGGLQNVYEAGKVLNPSNALAKEIAESYLKNLVIETRKDSKSKVSYDLKDAFKNTGVSLNSQGLPHILSQVIHWALPRGCVIKEVTYQSKNPSKPAKSVSYPKMKNHVAEQVAEQADDQADTSNEIKTNPIPTAPTEQEKVEKQPQLTKSDEDVRSLFAESSPSNSSTEMPSNSKANSPRDEDVSNLFETEIAKPSPIPVSTQAYFTGKAVLSNSDQCNHDGYQDIIIAKLKGTPTTNATILNIAKELPVKVCFGANCDQVKLTHKIEGATKKFVFSNQSNNPNFFSVDLKAFQIESLCKERGWDCSGQDLTKFNIEVTYACEAKFCERLLQYEPNGTNFCDHKNSLAYKVCSSQCP